MKYETKGCASQIKIKDYDNTSVLNINQTHTYSNDNLITHPNQRYLLENPGIDDFFNKITPELHITMTVTIRSPKQPRN